MLLTLLKLTEYRFLYNEDFHIVSHIKGMLVILLNYFAKVSQIQLLIKIPSGKSFIHGGQQLKILPLILEK